MTFPITHVTWKRKRVTDIQTCYECHISICFFGRWWWKEAYKWEEYIWHFTDDGCTDFDR